MSIFNNTEENYWRNLATKTVLVCITVAIIVWFLPRNEGRMYRYDVGKPWMYGSVIAKFDFPIYKTDEAIKHEQDSLLKHFQPYYSLNPLIEKKQVERFLHDYEQGINGLPKEYVGIVARQMQEPQGEQFLLHHSRLRAHLCQRETRSPASHPLTVQPQQLYRGQYRVR